MAAVIAQQVAQDSGILGLTPELMHLYYDEFPTGECLVQSY